MRKAVRLCVVFGVLTFVPHEALAQKTWSVQTGATVGTDVNVVHVQAGWPGISATLLHGYLPTVEGDVHDAVAPGYGGAGAVG